MTSCIAIDGSNIARFSGAPRVDYLEEVIQAISLISEPKQVSVRIIIDAALRHQVSPDDRRRLDELIDQKLVEVAPAAMSADRLIVEAAAAGDGVVVSNDLFRELRANYPWLGATSSKRVFGAFREPNGRWLFPEKNHGSEAPVFLKDAVTQPRVISAIPNASTPAPKVDQDMVTTPPAPISTKRIPGTYTMEVSREFRGAMVFLVDQSASMESKWKGGTRAEKVADVLNESFYEMILASTRASNNSQGAEVRPYFEVAVIGYGDQVQSMLEGTTLSNPFKTLTELADIPRLISVRGANGLVEEKVVWFDPVHSGKTAMCEALQVAKTVLERWTKEHPSSHPPIVFNITDGEQTDGDDEKLRSVANELKSVRTVDATLLVNAHISGSGDSGTFCPKEVSSGGRSLLMFEIASELPIPMVNEAKRLGHQKVEKGSRAYVFNGAPEQLGALINIGTPGTEVGT
jgi:hypothetical protein